MAWKHVLLVLSLLLAGSVAIASPAAATDDGRCADTNPSIIHDICNAATCPFFEPIEDCLEGG